MSFAILSVEVRHMEMELVQVPGRVVAVKVTQTERDPDVLMVEFTYVERKQREMKQ